MIECRSRNAALSEIKRLGLGSKRTRIGYPGISSWQGVDRVGAGCGIAVEVSGSAEPIGIHSEPILTRIGIVCELHDVTGGLGIAGSDRLKVHAAAIGKNESVLIGWLCVIVQVRGTRFRRSRRNGIGGSDSYHVNGICRSGSIGNGLPVPFSRFRKSLGSASHLMGGRIRGNLEVHGRIRRDGGMPIERIERRKDVRRRIGKPIVGINADGRRERVSSSGRIGAK